MGVDAFFLWPVMLSSQSAALFTSIVHVIFHVLVHGPGLHLFMEGPNSVGAQRPLQYPPNEEIFLALADDRLQQHGGSALAERA